MEGARPDELWVGSASAMMRWGFRGVNGSDWLQVLIRGLESIRYKR